MLVNPNSPDKNGNYLPYIHGETSHIYNTFDTIVKINMILEIKLKIKMYLLILFNYLNNTAFSINNEVLNFILDEWINEK